MKHLQWLLATACMLAVCLSVSAQSGKKVKSISPEKWVKSKVWSEGLKAKPHSSTNLAEFKAQYEANPEQWKAAFRWLASHDLTTIEKGKHPVEGTSLVVSVEDSKNEPLEKRTSESHRKHIDLQYVVKERSVLHCWIMSLQRLIANIVRRKMLFTMILIRKKLPLSTLFPVSFSCSSRPTGILQR